MFLPVGKFNQGVSADAKKRTWTEITNQVNSLGENYRQVCYCDQHLFLVLLVIIHMLFLILFVYLKCRYILSQTSFIYFLFDGKLVEYVNSTKD